MEINITPESPFSFRSTIYSHGWIDLAPFKLDKKDEILYYCYHAYGQLVQLHMKSVDDKSIKVDVKHNLSEEMHEGIIFTVKKMFRLDENFSEFYKLADESSEYKWIIKKGAGRMFRSACLWEDMVKMLCTTNCTWNLTKIMVNNLVEELGNGCFPDPEIVAKKSENYLRQVIKMGYRAPYLLEFAKTVANCEIDLHKYEIWEGETKSLYNELRNIKGFGPYAVSNLLKLLGHYDYYGPDSWSRKKFSKKYFADIACTEKDIAQHYDHFGNWSGLFFWMDMTEDWYQQKQPW